MAFRSVDLEHTVPDEANAIPERRRAHVIWYLHFYYKIRILPLPFKYFDQKNKGLEREKKYYIFWLN
jgi:hypothetical protein